MGSGNDLNDDCPPLHMASIAQLVRAEREAVNLKVGSSSLPGSDMEVHRKCCRAGVANLKIPH